MFRKLFLLAFFVFIVAVYAVAQSSWQEVKNEDGIKVWLKDTEGSAFKSFKVETVFNMDFKTVVAVLLDVKNIPKYYNTIYDVREIVDYSPKHAQYLLFFDFPWPVKDRFSLVESFVDVREDGSVLVSTKHKDEPSEKGGMMQVEHMESIWVLKEGPDGTTEVLHSGYMDPGGSVPAWLAKKSIIDNPFESVQRMRLRFPLYKDADVSILN